MRGAGTAAAAAARWRAWAIVAARLERGQRERFDLWRHGEAQEFVPGLRLVSGGREADAQHLRIHERRHARRGVGLGHRLYRDRAWYRLSFAGGLSHHHGAAR